MKGRAHNMSSLIGQPRFSCALAAQQTVLAIPRGIPIVHAGPGCSTKVFGFTALGSGFQGEGYAGGSAVSSTNTTEQDVVFGGEQKLYDLVESTLDVIDGDLYVVLSGCTSGIIGDDVVKVAGDFALEGHPVVGAETSGFKGNNYFGHELVVKEIIKQFVGKQKPQVRKGLVNVFSVVPYQNAYWRGDLEEIKRLLEVLGLEVNILFGYESKGIKEWQDIPNAEFNLVLSPWVGLETAEYLKKTYDIPYLHYPIFPVGGKATSQFLREVAEFAKLPKDHVESVIEREESLFYHYFIALSNFISDMRNNIPFDLYTVADSLYGLGASEFLYHELGFSVEGLYLVDNPPKQHQDRIKEYAARSSDAFSQGIEFHTDGWEVQQRIKETLTKSGTAAILGSTWEAELAKETDSVLVHLSLPINDDVIVTRSYFGYRGGLRLVEDLYSGIYKRGNITTLTQLKEV